MMTQMADLVVYPEVEGMDSHPMVYVVIGGALGRRGFGKERQR